MAILQDIRNRAGIFIMIFVGVALFLFVVDPTTFSVLFEKQDTSIAKIDDNKVDYQEFFDNYELHEQFLKIAQRTSSLDAETIEAIREQAWNDVIRKYLLDNHIENVGLTVSEVELEDLLYGANIHSIIHQNFTDQQTGRLDTLQVRNFFSTAEDQYETYLIADYFKTMIERDRVLTKFNNMLAKGYYVPTVLGKKDYIEKNTNTNFEYVVRKYRSIPDTEVEVSDSEIETYYKNNLYKYQVEHDGRDIEYVVFDVKPSTEDIEQAREIINNYYERFIESENPIDFARRYSDRANNDLFYSIDEMPKGLDSTFFHSEIGTVSDIKLVDNYYFAAMLVDEVMRPDSVNASHILIRPNEEEGKTIADCRLIADSLLQEINKGADFANLAFNYSEDPGSAQSGGELGWFTDGVMVPTFNEAAFTNDIGDIVKVESQFGVHIINILDQTNFQKKVKLAILEKELTFSEETYNAVYAHASNFSATSTTAEEYNENVTKNGLVKRIASDISELDKQIPGIENPREIIRWTYNKDTEVGSVSDVFIMQDKFIVAKLSAIRMKGDSPLEDVKDQITSVLVKEKKADKFANEINSDLTAGLSLEEISNKYGADKSEVENINFNTFSIPGVGIEPKLIAASYATEINQTNVVKGNNGVYVINVISKNTAPEKEDYSSEQLSLMRNFASRVGYRTIEALQKRADIEDYRSKWF